MAEVGSKLLYDWIPSYLAYARSHMLAEQGLLAKAREHVRIPHALATGLGVTGAVVLPSAAIALKRDLIERAKGSHKEDREDRREAAFYGSLGSGAGMAAGLALMPHTRRLTGAHGTKQEALSDIGTVSLATLLGYLAGDRPIQRHMLGKPSRNPLIP